MFVYRVHQQLTLLVGKRLLEENVRKKTLKIYWESLHLAPALSCSDLFLQRCFQCGCYSMCTLDWKSKDKWRRKRTGGNTFWHSNLDMLRYLSSCVPLQLQWQSKAKMGCCFAGTFLLSNMITCKCISCIKGSIKGDPKMMLSEPFIMKRLLLILR